MTADSVFGVVQEPNKEQPMNQYRFSDGDHLLDVIAEAMERFAVEDGCTVAEWAGRAVRYAAVERLTGEAAMDGFDTISAQRRPLGVTRNAD